MSLPLFPHKQKLPPLVTAEAYVKYYRKSGGHQDQPPPTLIISMLNHKGQQWSKEQGGKKKNFMGHEIYDFVDFGVLTNLGVGGAAMAMALEELAALGVKNFVCVGLAGALNEQLQPGDIILCEKALRDEGVSHHYLPEGAEVLASESLTQQLHQHLSASSFDFRQARTWTTDCPYRETKEEVLHYSQQGVMTVEMEAASLFAVAKVKKLQAAALFIISDVLSTENWTPHFYNKQVSQSFGRLLAQLKSFNFGELR